MNKNIKNTLALLSVLVFISLFILLAHYFGGEGTMQEPPQVVCKYSDNGEKCFITAHVHAELKLFKNDALMAIGYEKGNLEGNHTHSQKNVNHWHSLIKVDKNFKNKKYTFEDLTQFDNFSIKLIPVDFQWNKQFKKDPKKFIVNGNEVNATYRWKAGDKIEIHYD